MIKAVQEEKTREGVRHFSFSSINTYVNICSLQFFYRYVERRAPEKRSVHLIFGSAINDALVEIDRDLAGGQSPNLEKARDIFVERFAREQSDVEIPVEYPKGETYDSLFQKGTALIEHYVSELPEDEIPIMMDERRFSVSLSDEEGTLPRPFVGEFDRIVERAGKVGIVDWKTAARRWSQSDLDRDLQATSYLLAGREVLGQTPAFFRYDLLLKTKKPQVERFFVERDQRHFRRLVKLVRQVDRAIEADVFPPREKSWACGGCPYRRACDRWEES